MSGGTGLRVRVVRWHAVARWTWGAHCDGDVCGICQMPFEGCARARVVETARAAGSQPLAPRAQVPAFGEVSWRRSAGRVGQVCARVSPAVRLHVAADQDHVPDLSKRVGVRFLAAHPKRE